MPKIAYAATGFRKTSGRALAGTHTLNVPWSELVWAAITVGRAGLRQVLQFGIFSAFEMIYRAAMIYANLQETSTEYVTRSDAYNALDPSEKGAISYFLGLMTAKLFAEQCLKVSRLLHLDVYRAQLRPLLKRGRSKPDLVGLDDHGKWVVIESKGRTNGFDKNALIKAKKQSRRVKTISGSMPKFHVGMQSYFESSHLRMAVDDPDGETRGSLPDLPITREMVNREYYQPFRVWLDQGESLARVVIGDRAYIVRQEPTFDFVVGLAEEHYKGPATVRDEASAPMDIQMPTDDRFIGMDGILVQLGASWSSQSMRKQPEERIPVR